MSVEFNPLTQVLGENERLRILDGKLTVENSDFRKKEMSAWSRFWTRGQYSQSAILKEMGTVYKKAMNDGKSDQLNETFLTNYETLKGRAEAQNKAYEHEYAIVRFFEAKSFIDVTSADDKIKVIKSKLDDLKLQEDQKKQAEAQGKKSADDLEEAKKKLEADKKAIAEMNRLREEKKAAEEHAKNEAQIRLEIDAIKLVEAEIEKRKAYVPSEEDIQEQLNTFADTRELAIDTANYENQIRLNLLIGDLDIKKYT